MHHSSLGQILAQREVGLLRGNWQSRYQLSRAAAFGLGAKFFGSVFQGSVTWLDLERIENRYLLAAGADATVAVYDAQDTITSSAKTIDPICSIKKSNNPSSHRFLVSCVAWYPVDTGLFVTGSFDQEVKVWDTNVLQLACHFSMPAKVYALAMSPVATSHCLVAAGSAEPNVKLCDPQSGGFTHTLVGHREAVWALAWMLHNEFQLMSGDAGGQIRVWDVRRSGCMAVLDQYCTQRPSKQPAAASQPSTSSIRMKRPREEPGSRGYTGGKGSGPAQAHHGAVNSLLATPDGLHLISAGTDMRVRLWHAQDHHHLLTNYPDTVNKATRGRQLSTSDDGRLLFHPTRKDVQVFDVASGAQLALLQQGHFDTVNCCIYNPSTQELYSGGSDCQILSWDTRTPAMPFEPTDSRGEWSEDDD